MLFYYSRDFVQIEESEDWNKKFCDWAETCFVTSKFAENVGVAKVIENLYDLKKIDVKSNYR
jgi:hypothetical protein